MSEGVEAEVPRCHLHARKPNKACKFCKAFVAYQEQKQKEEDDKKKAIIEKLKASSSQQGKAASVLDPIPIPNQASFPTLLKERILLTRIYRDNLMNQSFEKVVGWLSENCETCELDVHNGMDVEPSHFFSCLYRLLTIKLTEGQLRELMENQLCCVRCAGFLYVRLFCHSDRYWDLLSDSLVDEEEFVPFPKDGKDSENTTVGEYVESLLVQDKYLEITLPRITAAQRKMITERLCLYGQFRKRYQQNLEVLDRFEKLEGGVEVEVCAEDGEWFAATTAGARSYDSRLVTVPIFNPSAKQVEHISISKIICVDREPRDSKDLTRSRGTSNQELLEKCREQQRASALSSDKNYSRSHFQHQIRIGGVSVLVGQPNSEQPKRNLEQERKEALEEEQALKRRKEMHEAEAKRAEIEAKYLGTASSSKQSRGSVGLEPQGPERLRLG